MTSDFSAARVHLDRAYHYLRGDDPISRRGREALDLLLEAVTVEEFKQPRQNAEMLMFPIGRRFRVGHHEHGAQTPSEYRPSRHEPKSGNRMGVRSVSLTTIRT